MIRGPQIHRHRVDGRGGALSKRFSPRRTSPQVFWIAIAAFALMLIAGSRAAIDGAADPDGLAVPDAGDLPRDDRLRAGFRPRRHLDPAAARADCSPTARALQWSLPARWQWPLVTWALDRRDRVADRVPARGRFRAVDSAAEAGVEHQHRHRARGRSGRTSPTSRSATTLGILFVDALFRWYANEPRALPA